MDKRLASIIAHHQPSLTTHHRSSTHPFFSHHRPSPVHFSDRLHDVSAVGCAILADKQRQVLSSPCSSCSCYCRRCHSCGVRCAALQISNHRDLRGQSDSRCPCPFRSSCCCSCDRPSSRCSCCCRRYKSHIRRAPYPYPCACATPPSQGQRRTRPTPATAPRSSGFQQPHDRRWQRGGRGGEGDCASG